MVGGGGGNKKLALFIYQTEWNVDVDMEEDETIIGLVFWPNTKSHSISRSTLYLLHQLPHYSIPLLLLPVIHPVHVIRHQLDRVLETDLAGDSSQQIYAETLEAIVAGQVSILPEHYVGLLLDNK